MLSPRSWFQLSLVMTACLCGAGCVTAKGGSPTDKRADANRMRDEALGTFYSAFPNMRSDLAKAAGYGVFSGISTHTIIVASGNGYGIIRDNSTGKDTYMRALKLGGGFGAGAADIRAVVVFHDRQAMLNAIEQGWGATGRGEASAKVGDKGEANAVVVTFPGMSIYRFTKTGAMLGGAVEGVKIWPDDEMNSP